MFNLLQKIFTVAKLMNSTDITLQNFLAYVMICEKHHTSSTYILTALIFHPHLIFIFTTEAFQQIRHPQHFITT